MSGAVGRIESAGLALRRTVEAFARKLTLTTNGARTPFFLMSCGLIDKANVDDYCWKLLEQIAECEVANHPGRLEPRVVERRPKPYKLMRKPRNELRRELRNRCT